MDFNPQSPSEYSAWRNQLISIQAENHDIRDGALFHHLNMGKTGRFYMNEFCDLPILQTADDLLQLQNIYWNYRPSLVIETGIARGGSLLFHAYHLLFPFLLGLTSTNPVVVGIDVLIHDYNRSAIESSPLSSAISLIENSSISPEILTSLSSIVTDIIDQPKVIILDSNHTHDHVLAELELYSEICKSGDYIIVFDTIVEYIDALDPSSYLNRPWGKGSNPLTAVNQFLATTDSFERQDIIDHKLVASGAINGWLRKK